MPKKIKKQIKEEIALPKGTFDILPSDEKYWERVENVAKNISREYGFVKIETPIFEHSNVYLRTIGEATDVVEKQMYYLKTKGDKLVLRPEGTAGIARAYLVNGLFEQPQPVKLFYFGPFFRYEQPQSGRFRQFHQFGLELIGDQDPINDAEIINILCEIFNKFGVKNLAIELNSIGCKLCRPKFKSALLKYYRPKVKNLCQNCKQRIDVNPLRLLDCKEEGCRKFIENAPQIVDKLCEDCKNHFKLVIEYLDELGLPYILNPHLVRGFDYYTKTVFEIFYEDSIENHKPNQLALASGGRYDYLVKELGGRAAPAVGGAFGFERLIGQMKKQNVKINDLFEPEVFVIQLGPTAKKKALKLFENLRKSGFKAAQSFGKDSLATQLARADRLKVKTALILGQKEIFDESIIIKEMDTGVQETIPMEKLMERLKEKLR